MEKENVYSGNKTFEIGDFVTHVTTGWEMQVMAYGRPDNDMRLNFFDYGRFICKYWHPTQGAFVNGMFEAMELKKKG